MKKQAIRKYVVPAVSLAVLFIILWSVALPLALKMQLEDILHDYGFETASVEKAALYNNVILFEGIKLDPNGFSTIGAVSGYYRFPALLTESGFDKLVVEDLVLSGEFNNKGQLTVAGWSNYLPAAHDALNEAPVIELYSAKLDILTAAGAIRIEGKGKATHSEKGKKSINLSLWGKQHQIQFDTHWKGEITPDGNLLMDISVNDIRLKLEHMAASRINGWLTLEKPATQREPVPAHIAGQLAIGKMRIGDIGFTGTTLTIEKQGFNTNIFANARASGYDEMVMSAEWKRNKDENFFSGSYIANGLDPFLSFMTALHHTLDKTPYIAEVYKTSPLDMLGQERTRKDISDIINSYKYDRIEFTISGAPHDMAGKITARYTDNGKPGRHVIRLSPTPPEALHNLAQ